MALATAVLLLLMLAGVAAYIVSLSGSQQASSGMDAVGQQAYQAARSGAEYGVWNAVKPVAPACPAAQTIAAGSMAGTLAPYTVTINCTATNHTEAAVNLQAFTVTSTACNRAACPAAAPSANYVERQVTLTAWK